MIKLTRIIKEAKAKDGQEMSLKEFAKLRLAGAEKISNDAKEKGGVSTLTYDHFKVKLPFYEKAANGTFDLGKASEEYLTLLNELFKTTNKDMAIEQRKFQELVGKIEALGELIIMHK